MLTNSHAPPPPTSLPRRSLLVVTYPTPTLPPYPPRPSPDTVFLSALPYRNLPYPANPDSLANLRNPSNLRHHRHTVLSTATIANLRTLVAYCYLLVFRLSDSSKTTSATQRYLTPSNPTRTPTESTMSNLRHTRNHCYHQLLALHTLH